MKEFVHVLLKHFEVINVNNTIMEKDQVKELIQPQQERFRAVCKAQTKKWEGPWRTSYDEAYIDARLHTGGVPFEESEVMVVRMSVQEALS